MSAAKRFASPARLAVPLLALLAAQGSAPVAAQSPHQEWRTLTLPHFRVHYPAASEAWTFRAAARLEAVRERLREEVGYAPPRVVDVVIADPLSRPNGSAWPFLAHPRMVLWTTPPEPSSILGRYRDWGEIVALHEDAHLVHLLRPSRNPWRRLTGRLVPGGGIGPIALGAPRWVTEGYATLLEGRLTAAGRPHSDLRAAVLRRRALAGRLPGYGALGAGDESWLGRSMAYLAGSAYLEWLVERAGPEALRDLWARLTARRARSFEEAFRGVFGEGPAELYGRFAAELTWRSLEAQRRLGAPEGRAVGELWRDLTWESGAPAVSPDGSRVAAVVRDREEPPRLVVWETAVDEEEERRYREERARIAAADPEDVPAVRTAPPFRKTVATLPTCDGRAPLEPRWSPDGESLLFVALGPDAAGFQRADLYRWRVGDGDVERLTREADLRSPDPVAGRSPDRPAGAGGGGRAVAVRSRHGLTQLVEVDLGSGAVRPLTEASAEVTWATPRVAPGGRRLAALRHRDGAWRLVVAELSAGDAPEVGALRELPVPAGATVADPAWSPDGRTLYAAVGGGGFVDLWAFDPGEAGPPEVGPPGRRLTETLGAALAPEPTPDGEALFFLSLEHDGLDLRRLALAEALSASRPAARAPLADDPGELAPAIPPLPPAGESFAAGELPPPRPYGAGPQDATVLAGVALAPSGLALEAGARVGDVVGRFDGFLLGSLGSAGALEGGALAAAWRGLPVALTAQLFAVSEAPSEQDLVPAVAGVALDRDVTGAYLSGAWHGAFPAGEAAARLGVHGARVELPARGRVHPPDRDAAAATATAAVAWAPSRGRRSLPMELGLRLQEGATDSERWRRWSARGGLGLDLGDIALRVAYARHGSDGLVHLVDHFQVGGVRRSLLPEDVDFARIPVPALPAGMLIGEEHESQRLELGLELLPAPLFFERHRVWGGDLEKGDWLSLAGIELEGALPPYPLLGLPGSRFTAGAAYVLEDPFGELEDEVRLWAALAWRP